MTSVQIPSERPSPARQPLRSETESADLNNLAAEGWHKCVRTMEDYDKRLLGGWREELNNLLIFAGLFSAVVTAFGVEAYSWLKPDSQDQTVELLRHISLQLSSFSASSTYLNSTTPPLVDLEYHTSSTVKAINILWFLSLSFSLASAVFAILVQQWIRQYLDVPLITGREWACVRQRRFDGLDRWMVPQIISALSLALQASLILFLGGLVTLLWSLNHVVAISVMVAVAVFLVAFLITTITPSFAADCPYKSPLAWATYVSISYIAHPILVPVERLLWWCMVVLPASANFRLGALWLRVQDNLPKYKCTSWPEYQGKRRQPDSEVALRAIKWTSKTLSAAAIDSDVIAACLVYHDNPVQVLFQWIANTSGVTTESVRTTVKTMTWWQYASVRLQTPQKPDKRVTQALIRRACEYLIERGERHERAAYALPMLHLLRWLDIKGGTSVAAAPLLWHAIEATQATSPEHTWFLSSQLYEFYDTSVLNEQHSIGAAYTRKWFLRVFDLAMLSLRKGESSSYTRYAFELAWLASYRSLASAPEKSTTTQLQEQYDPIWNAIFEYFGFEVVKPKHTTRWGWFAAFEIMLKSSQAEQPSEISVYYQPRAQRLIDIYVVKSLPDWKQDAEYAHVFSDDSMVQSPAEYPYLRAYLLEQHPGILPSA